MKNNFSNIFVISFLAFLFLPFFCFADSQGQRVNFFVDQSYDLSGRDQISATLVSVNPRLYFYIDDS
jgi:hypothetical protein